MGEKYLITKRGSYYRPNAQGYTASAIIAGRYSFDDAHSHSHPNGINGPRDGMGFIHEDSLTDEDWIAHKAAIERLQSFIDDAFVMPEVHER